MARYLLFHNVMKTPFKYIVSIAALTFALTLSAKATFVENTDFKGEPKLFNDQDHKNVTFFTATVGGHKRCPQVLVQTDGHVDSGCRIRKHHARKRRATHLADFHPGGQHPL